MTDDAGRSAQHVLPVVEQSRAVCVRIQASQTTRASLMSSDGWAVNEPRWIQLRLPPYA